MMRANRAAKTILNATAFIVLALGGLASAQKTKADADPRVEFFDKSPVSRIEIRLGEESASSLRAEPRRWSKAQIYENGKLVLEDAGIKLKGAAGSFRELDDKPALTIDTDRFKKGQLFHGLERFHLNNSVQDESFLHERLASELFRAAGLPATRVTHAIIRIDDRDLGLYVLKEGFDERFLALWFEDPEGDLYDGGFCQDIDAELEKDSGKDAEDRTRLKSLLEAVRIPDPEARSQRLEQLVDIPSFITFMSMELMIGHWDGYAMTRNNYRLYFDPTTGKAVFLPHGMDQVFGDAGASILEMPGALVAAAVMKNPAWRIRFRKRTSELLSFFLPAEKLTKRLSEAMRRLRPAVESLGDEFARAHADRVRDLEKRLIDRSKSLKEQVAEPEPKPIAFAGKKGTVKLKGWRSMSECEDAILEEKNVGGERQLLIATGKSGRCIASWRKNVFLAKGRYKFQVTMSAKDVRALEGDGPSGVSLRLANGAAVEVVEGTRLRRSMEFEFTVSESAEHLELVMQLVASKGQVTFVVDSLKLSRLGD